MHMIAPDNISWKCNFPAVALIRNVILIYGNDRVLHLETAVLFNLFPICASGCGHLEPSCVVQLLHT